MRTNFKTDPELNFYSGTTLLDQIQEEKYGLVWELNSGTEIGTEFWNWILRLNYGEKKFGVGVYY